MIVSMWMTRNVVTIGPHAAVTEAAALMAHHHVRRLPVAEQHGSVRHLIGMVSASDILRAFPPNVNPFAVETPQSSQPPLTIGEIMHREVETTTPDTPIEEAAALMRDEKIGVLPVLREGNIVGMITESDIFRAIVGLLTVPGKGVRITFDVSRNEDVFGFIAPLARQHGMRVVSLISTDLDNRPECVVRVAGDNVDRFLDDIWASGHLVLNVLRFPIQHAA